MYKNKYLKYKNKYLELKTKYRVGPTEYDNGEKFSELRLLQEGSYGKVYNIKDPTDASNRSNIAVKVLKEDNPKHKKSLYDECSILKKLKDAPNIVQVKENCKDDVKEQDTLTLELCENGSLSEFNDKLHSILGRIRGMTYDKKFDILLGIIHYLFKQLVNAVERCHQLDIIHRDIKLSNCLLDKDFNLKLTDFGLSTYTPGDMNIIKGSGTPQYNAPELLYTQQGIKYLMFLKSFIVNSYERIHRLAEQYKEFGNTKRGIKMAIQRVITGALNIALPLTGLRFNKSMLNNMIDHELDESFSGETEDYNPDESILHIASLIYDKIIIIDSLVDPLPIPEKAATKIDIYAMGVFIYRLYLNKRIQEEPGSIPLSILDFNFNFDIYTKSGLNILLDGMLDFNSDTRFTIQQIKASAWYKNDSLETKSIKVFNDTARQTFVSIPQVLQFIKDIR